MYPYLGELLTEDKRSKLMILIGYALSIGMFLMSSVGWTLQHYFPRIQITEKHAITPWRIQMIVLLIPGAIAAFLYHRLPESPKFLMTVGETDKAMQVLKRMHKTGPRTHMPFPIGALKEENINPQSHLM